MVAVLAWPEGSIFTRTLSVLLKIPALPESGVRESKHRTDLGHTTSPLIADRSSCDACDDSSDPAILHVPAMVSFIFPEPTCP
jgi:hypothetical protein